MRRRVTLAAGALALLPAAATADSAMSGGLSALRGTDSYRASAFQAAQTSPVWTNNRCEDAKGALDSSVNLIADPTFDAQGAAQSGAWIEHILVEGCGVKRQFNVLFRVRKPGDVIAIPLLPGTTRTDPVLGSDAATYALAAAAKGTACKGAYVLETTFIALSEGPPAVPGKPGWTERWTVAHCDTRVPVLMRFTPDQTGTAISAHEDKP